MSEAFCGRCSNSGWIVVRAATLAYLGPGPCDDDVPGVLNVRCKACDRAWVHIYEFSRPENP
jgi:hypothetical protein